MVSRTLLAALLSLLVPTALAAGSETEPLLKRQDIVEQLSPAPRTRGLVLVETAAPASLSFSNVQFEFDSARLTPEARQQVGEIAAALNDERLGSYRFEIAGHADATGSRDYNMTLSAARARAVVEELVLFGVAADRLQSRGWGFDRPLPDIDPYDARQRRVEVVNLDS
jgi:outer membrane protein OmpA-like peptidoglycan-associated protein